MARTIKHGDTWFIDDENYDYSKEIQKAVDEGNYQKAAYLEKSRNAKIDRFVMPYDKTYAYQDFLPVGKSAEAEVPSFEDSTNAQKAARTLSRANAMNFHYNPQQDPLYKNIKNNYQKSVGDVIDNTMGSYAGMTGGMPSSYAVSAAATAGNQHMQKADDMIPELYQLAYGKYADDKADLYKQYGIYQDLENQAYTRGYNEKRDAISDEWTQKQWDYSMGKENEQKVNDRISMMLGLGMAPDEGDIKASGLYGEMTPEQILTAYNEDEKVAEANNRIAMMLTLGLTPSAEDIAASKLYGNITPEELLKKYKETNAPRVVSSGSGQQSSDKNLENAYKMVDDMIEEIKNDEDGDKSISDINIAPIVQRYNLTPEQEALLYIYLEGFGE